VEVVVVDDGSEDGTRKYLQGLDDSRIRPLFQEHQGAQVARNKGQETARGNTIKHMDDDDHLVPGELVREYRTLQETGADVCYGDFYKVDEVEDTSWVHTNAPHSEVDADFFTALVSGAVNRLQLAILFEASAIEDLRWDESLEYLQDVDFMLRASTRGLSCVKLDRPVAVHRMHSGPRISDVRESAAATKRLDMQAQWSDRAFKKLETQRDVTEARRTATAKGLWQLGHRLAPHDWESGYHWLRRAVEIDGELRPTRGSRTLSVMDRVLSPLTTEKLVNPFRKYRLSFRD